MSKAMIMNMGASYTPVVEFVSKTVTRTANGSSISVSLSDVQSGDMILLYFYVGGYSADMTSNMSLSTSGYTELESGFNYGGVASCSHKIFGKIADGTETSISVNQSGSSLVSNSYHAVVIRGTDGTLPTQANGKIVEFATGTGGTAFWSPISTGSSSDLLLLSVGCGHRSGYRYYTVYDVDANDRTAMNDSYDVSSALGYFAESAGGFDPSNWLITISSAYSCGTIRSVIRLSA